MKTYTLRKQTMVGGIIYSTLVPKRPGNGFSFKAGQYIAIGFKGSNGRPSPMRCFSITSSAVQNGSVEIATRLSGDFTHALSQVLIGSDIFVQGPFGEFTVNQQYDHSIVMIAGGIGITPFMSMIRTATQTAQMQPMTLLYSYRSGHDIPFHDELRRLEAHHPQLRIIIFVSDKTAAPNIPRLLSGRMTEQHIAQVTNQEYVGSTYFICGPNGFMESAQSMLNAKGVSEDRIVTESFTQSSNVQLGNGFNARKITYAFAGAVLLLGVLSIGGLDLIRYVPKHTVSAAAQQTSSTAVTPSSSSTSSSSSSNTTSQTTYQQPVTSVS